MEDFLIMVAPLLVITAAVIGLFVWGSVGNVIPEHESGDGEFEGG